MQQQSMAVINRRIGVALAWATGKRTRGQLWAVALSAVCLMALIQGQAAGSLVPLPANGVNWQYDYNPSSTIADTHHDGLPSFASPAWTPYSHALSTTISLQDSYVQLSTPNPDPAAGATYWGTTTGWPGTGSMTVEFTLRIEQAVSVPVYVILFPDSTHDLQINIGPSAAYFTGGSGGTITGDFTQWTTFRLVLNDWSAGTPTTTVYLNNSYPPSLIVSGAGNIANAGMTFGENNPGANAGAIVDFGAIRWTSGEFFIPEPSVMCLFGLGGALLFRLRSLSYGGQGGRRART